MLKTIAHHLGGIIKYEEIIQNTGLTYKEVKKILPLLEDSFVVQRLTPFYKNLSNELRKNPKIYFIDYGIRNYLLEDFENIQFDFLYENFIYNQLRNQYHMYYWRTTAKITRAMRSFIEAYKPKKAIIASLKEIKKEKINNCSLEIVPMTYL
ncbi:DUF4143 domain-containing protein [Candidatus Woesearchaeota archaeon]|nr:DUF4143 domain-containing protein [Candidatus Woesearchaeota archaeon]